MQRSLSIIINHVSTSAHLPIHRKKIDLRRSSWLWPTRSNRLRLELDGWGDLPSGKLTVCYWKWPLIIDLPIKHGWFFHSSVAVYQRVPWSPRRFVLFYFGRRRCTWWWMLGLEVLVTAMRAPPPWWLKQLTAYWKMRTQAAAPHVWKHISCDQPLGGLTIEATWGKPLLQVSLPVAAIILFQLSCSNPWAPTPDQAPNFAVAGAHQCSTWLIWISSSD